MLTLFCQSQQNLCFLCAFQFGYNDFSYIVTLPIAMLFVGSHGILFLYNNSCKFSLQFEL